MQKLWKIWGSRINHWYTKTRWMSVFILSLNFRTPCYSNLWAWASLVSVGTSCLCMPCQDRMWKQHCLAFQLWRFFITSIMINLWKGVKEKCYQEIVALCLLGTSCDSCWSLIAQFIFECPKTECLLRANLPLSLPSELDLDQYNNIVITIILLCIVIIILS